jgi:type II secretory pathway pseudopilin PulG
MSRARVIATAPGGPRRPAGVILLALLLGLALGAIALMAAVDSWALASRRDREQQLLFAGDQYRQALMRYYFAAPGGTPRVLPPSLEALLEDDRYPVPLRHLRRLYPDPITGTPEWGELRDGDRIAGVYSLSEAEPVKRAGFPPAYDSFSGRGRYRDWVFAVAIPRHGITLPPPAAGTPTRTTPPPPTRPTRAKAS